MARQHGCAQCDRTFPSGKALDRHVGRVHAGASSKGRAVHPAVWALVGLAVLATAGAFLLQGSDTSAPADRYHIGESAHMGNLSAPVALVAFESPQCPSCRLFHTDRDGSGSTFEKIVRDFVAPGTVVYAEKTFFIGEPWEREAAHGQKCAWAQSHDAFFALTHSIYVDQDRISPSQLRAYLRSVAEREGLDIGEFDRCIDERAHANSILLDLGDAQAAGVRGTPTFIVVASDGTPSTITGPQPYVTFHRALTHALDAGGPG